MLGLLFLTKEFLLFGAPTDASIHNYWICRSTDLWMDGLAVAQDPFPNAVSFWATGLQLRQAVFDKTHGVNPRELR